MLPASDREGAITSVEYLFIFAINISLIPAVHSQALSLVLRIHWGTSLMCALLSRSLYPHGRENATGYCLCKQTAAVEQYRGLWEDPGAPWLRRGVEERSGRKEEAIGSSVLEHNQVLSR